MVNFKLDEEMRGDVSNMSQALQDTHYHIKPLSLSQFLGSEEL